MQINTKEDAYKIMLEHLDIPGSIQIWVEEEKFLPYGPKVPFWCRVPLHNDNPIYREYFKQALLFNSQSISIDVTEETKICYCPDECLVDVNYETYELTIQCFLYTDPKTRIVAYYG